MNIRIGDIIINQAHIVSVRYAGEREHPTLRVFLSNFESGDAIEFYGSDAEIFWNYLNQDAEIISEKTITRADLRANPVKPALPELPPKLQRIWRATDQSDLDRLTVNELELIQEYRYAFAAQDGFSAKFSTVRHALHADEFNPGDFWVSPYTERQELRYRGQVVFDTYYDIFVPGDWETEFDALVEQAASLTAARKLKDEAERKAELLKSLTFTRNKETA